MKQLELQKETEADPYIIFEYSIRSPYTKESYFRRLKRFFDAISLEGPTFESRCNFFAEKGKQDPNWAFNSILKFVLQEKNQEEVAVGPVRVLSNCCLTTYEILLSNHCKPVALPSFTSSTREEAEFKQV